MIRPRERRLSFTQMVRNAVLAARKDSAPQKAAPSGRVYRGMAWGCMQVDHPVRALFIRLVEWPWFDRTVLVLIVANCVVMASKDPLSIEDPEWVFTAEWFFTVAFSLEAVSKMVAMGLYCESPTTYFRSGWHWLDVLTVGVSWMSLLAPDAGNLSALRSVRVLRPLRTVTRIKSMRVLVGALLRSLPDVADVVLLFGFFLLAFGVVGVELFMGRLGLGLGLGLGFGLG